MNVTIASHSLAAQSLGPTPRDAAVRIAHAASSVAPPVGDSVSLSIDAARNVRLAGSYDERSGRVVTWVIDQASGEVIEQYPDDDALRVLAGIREMIGLVVDASA